MRTIKTALVAATVSNATLNDKLCKAPTLGRSNVRIDAAASIAPRAYSESIARNALVASLEITLGKTPHDDLLAWVKRELIVGRVAARVAPSEFPVSCTAIGDRLDHVRLQIVHYMAPPTDGKAAGKLQKGMLGRRSPIMHKAIRAGEQWASQLLAELSLSNAQTQKAKNEKQAEKAKGNNTDKPGGATNQDGKAKPGTHSEVAKAIAPKDVGEFLERLGQMHASMLAFCNKYAGLAPASVAALVATQKSEMDVAIGSAKLARGIAETVGEAKAADKAKRKPRTAKAKAPEAA